MSFSLATLWHERQRFRAGVMAVAFSAVLIALQFGLLLGLLSVTSVPIDRTRADIWVGAADVPSVDVGAPMAAAWLSRVAESPEVAACEEYCQGYMKWKKPNGGEELCIIIGSRIEDG